MKITLSAKLEREESIYNLKHCCIKEFNDLKPDAVSVCAYTDDAELSGPANLAVLEFVPFGEWGRAEEGVAYNLPTSSFEFNLISIGL